MTSDELFVLCARTQRMLIAGKSAAEARDFLFRALAVPKQPSLPTLEPAPEQKSSAELAAASARRVFEYWAQRTGRKQSKLTPERQRVIVARLRDSYTEQDILDAIDGCLSSPHHTGDNESGTTYDDLTLICRNGSKLEGFIRMKRGGQNGSESRAEELRRQARELRGE